MAKQKFYAVVSGRKTGIFRTWSECSKAVQGYSGAQYKSFATLAEARAYLTRGDSAAPDPGAKGGQARKTSRGSDIWAQRIKADQEAGILVAFTDGSYEHRKKKYAYGVVLVEPDGARHDLCGSGAKASFLESRNIAGEVMGVLGALDWASEHGYHRVRVYHDYQGLSSWAKGLWQAKTPISIFYIREFQSKTRGIQVDFQKVPAHSNVDLNERADQLAKRALDKPIEKRVEESRAQAGAPSRKRKGGSELVAQSQPKESVPRPNREVPAEDLPAFASDGTRDVVAYAFCGQTDLRQSVWQLRLQACMAGLDPADGREYLFLGRSGNRVKVLACQGNAYSAKTTPIPDVTDRWPEGVGFVPLSHRQYERIMGRAPGTAK